MGDANAVSEASGERIRFLFRNEHGVIDAPTWRFHAAWLLGALILLALGWVALRPYAHHDLSKTAFIAPMTILAFAYLIVGSFAVLLTAVCYVMLSMKRCRDGGWPVGLAGLVPLLVLFAASLHFLHAQTPDVIALWHVALADAALAAAVAWTIVELGGLRQMAARTVARPPADL